MRFCYLAAHRTRVRQRTHRHRCSVLIGDEEILVISRSPTCRARFTTYCSTLIWRSIAGIMIVNAHISSLLMVTIATVRRSAPFLPERSLNARGGTNTVKTGAKTEKK